MKRAKPFLRRILPAPLLAWWRRRHSLRFTGPFQSWAAASAASSGYATSAILDRVTAATQSVLAGRAAYERDSCLFSEPEVDPILMQEIEWVAARGGPEPLVVLDFGGSLGSTYHQHRNFLPRNRAIRWHIVEQPHFVARGRERFETGDLRFFASIDEAVSAGQPALVVASSVLCYLESPWNLLERLSALPAAAWFVSRTAFVAGPSDLLFVQHVPPSIYPGSYPLWALSEPRFEEHWRRLGAGVTWQPTPEGAAGAGENGFRFKTAVVRRG